MLTILFDRESSILENYESRYLINEYAKHARLNLYEIKNYHDKHVVDVLANKDNVRIDAGKPINVEWNSRIITDIDKLKADEDKSLFKPYKALEILKLVNADILCTNNEKLLLISYNIFNYEQFYVVPDANIIDILKSHLAGNEVFASPKYNFNNIGFDVFYIKEHTRLSRYFIYFLGRKHAFKGNSTEHLRSIICHRMPFILYSRDKIKSKSYEKFRAERLNQKYKNNIELAYYINAYYVYIFGLLDHLCVLTNDMLDWKLNERNCSIVGKTFRKELRNRAPGLDSFLSIPTINDWLDIITSIRHKSAHEIVKLTSDLLIKTEKSEISDDRIKEILRKENPERYTIMKDNLDLVESLWIYEWRISQCKKFSSTKIQISTRKGFGFYDPILSVDREIDMLFAITDAFLSYLICNK